MTAGKPPRASPQWPRSPLSRRIAKIKTTLTPTTTEDRNILYVGLDGVTVGLSAPAMAFLSVFIVRLGADALWIGLLSSLPALVKLLLALPLSRFVERQPNPVPLFAWCRLIGRGAYLIAGILPFFLSHILTAQAIVLLWGVAAVLMVIQEITFSLVMNHTVQPTRRAVLMSTRWTVLGVAEMIVLSISVILLERIAFPLNYQVLFLGSFLFSTLGFYTISRVKVIEQDSPALVRPGLAPAKVGLRQELREVFQQTEFVIFALARNVFWLGISMALPLIPIFWVDNVQASDAWVGYFNTAISAATLVSYSFWVRLKGKRGTRTTLLASVLGRSIYPLLVAFAPSPPAMLAVSLVNGFAFAGQNLMFFEAFMDTLPKGKEARYLAINQALNNLIGFIAPPLGVWLYAAFGIQVALAGGTIMALVGSAIFLLGGVGKPSAKPATLPL